MKENRNRIIEAIDFESNDQNWKYDFQKMTKSYGRDFIDMLKMMWFVNESQTEDEFCKMNGISIQFFQKTIKNDNATRNN